MSNTAWFRYEFENGYSVLTNKHFSEKTLKAFETEHGRLINVKYEGEEK